MFERSNRRLVIVLAGVLAIFSTFSVKQVILGADTTDRQIFLREAEASVASLGLPHWWPIWADKNTFAGAPAVSARGRAIDIRRDSAEFLDFTVAPGGAATVRVNRVYYPFWTASVNGKAVQIRNSEGAVSFEIGSEESVVSIAFVEPGYTFVSRLISAITVTVMLALIILFRFKRNGNYE